MKTCCRNSKTRTLRVCFFSTAQQFYGNATDFSSFFTCQLNQVKKVIIKLSCFIKLTKLIVFDKITCVFVAYEITGLGSGIVIFKSLGVALLSSIFLDYHHKVNSALAQWNLDSTLSQSIKYFRWHQRLYDSIIKNVNMLDFDWCDFIKWKWHRRFLTELMFLLCSQNAYEWIVVQKLFVYSLCSIR